LGVSEDCDINGIPDECDIAAGAADADGDGIPDVCAGQNFIRGECNGDDSITIADAIFLLGFLFNSGPAPTCQDACDINDDSGIDIGDGVYLLAYLFNDGFTPGCLDAADTNDDGGVNISDAVTLLAVLFSGAAPLPEPVGSCGQDPTDDALECEDSGDSCL